ncbi:MULTISPECIES: aspartate kinase [unclassified Gemella]|uniref:aspartate kinase n=1 Tax=unclassified Gemella TaxID=2624949 RepID=UPI0010730606|nr:MULTISPECIES: aspartate kinase [unclassified Gemella]MBF0709636.1 aspartate kinase [Gemella sp. GL1.1]MBF0746945.1 aspartate kinase [Gemella sp. 19428wG2_WT2a]NYS26980.1 aspartate kinase [Gemella sp. GL1]TFU59170.1 aspartate kinase [Gemella sp. WT2a]
MVKVSKFGGSSVASAEQFKKVKSIVQSDQARKLVVVSAAGKAHKEDNKITDLLYLCHAHIKYGISFDNIYSIIENKFLNIKNTLKINFDIESELSSLKQELIKGIDEDYLISRGEYLTGLLMAQYLGYKFVDPKNLIFFNYNGNVDYQKSQEAFDKLLTENNNLLIPGFYGSLPNGEIKVMTRGGGDVTGAIIANLANAEIYENWTDVSGVLMADPRIVDSPKEIDVITYTELRELSYMGASILHEEAIFPIKEKGIPIQIRNTNKPESLGTIIKNTERKSKSIITGIAGKKDFSIISIKKNHMSTEVGLINKTLALFESYNVSIEHIPTGIDSFSIVVETASIKPFIHELLSKIKDTTNADEVSIVNELSLIATVGHQMKNHKGMSGRLFTALGKNNINIMVISQTNDEINIIIGVHNSDYEKTIATIYNEFAK